MSLPNPIVYLLLAVIVLFTLLGHGALWVSLVNRANSLALNHQVLRIFNRLAMLACGLIPLGVVACIALRFSPSLNSSEAWPFLDVADRAATLYAIACQLIGGWTVLLWLYRCSFLHANASVRSHREERIDVTQVTGETLAGNRTVELAMRLPGNQFFDLSVGTREIEILGLPKSLDGFSIAHLSDFHMAGHVRLPFYKEVVRQANALDADIVAITGDIIDKRVCLEWLQPTLGNLRSRNGVYFVLGNHDSRDCPATEVRDTLTRAGLIDLGGSCCALKTNEATILLVGNEIPWQKNPLADKQLPVGTRDAETLSILLSHSPDQLAWATRRGYHLMLAGHAHGGQIRLPWIGPLLTPCWHGVAYSAGTFRRGKTFMHVTRGISGMRPLRLNCPAELTKLVLRQPATRANANVAVG